MKKFGFALSSVVTFAFLVLGCEGDANRPQGPCGPDNCGGCCLGDRCEPGLTISACGTGGIECNSCAADEHCPQGVCVSTSSGCSSANCDGCCDGNTCNSGAQNTACGKDGVACENCQTNGGYCDGASQTCISGNCTPDCTGKCAGGSDGCGGTCQINDCDGCCLGTQCMAGILDTACGTGGGSCVDCSAMGSTCSSTGVCGNCTPNCTGKCNGASDGCGSVCQSNSCNGCCNGTQCIELLSTSDTQCGSGGAQCTNCAASGATCVGGACSGSCTPNCAGKCNGASDGCGSTCSVNSCTGCCDENTRQCYPGTSDSACGSSGAKCYVCPADFQGYKWKCDNKTCVKDTPTSGTNCTGKTGGTDSCTESGVSGKCWDNLCCTGCYNTASSSCVGQSTNTTCGTSGVQCQNCTSQNKTCVSGTCQSTTPACGADGTSCPAGGPVGTCVGGTCCTTCTYSVSGVLKCATAVGNSRCGIDGETCDWCYAWEPCNTNVGQCEIDPTSDWNITVREARISIGKTWDTFGSPDPLFALTWGSCPSGSLLPWFEICTGYIADTHHPQWDYTVGPYDASKLMAASCVYILDRDSGNCNFGTHNLIGKCQISITHNNFKVGYKEITSCPNPDGTNYVPYIRLEFTNKP